MIYYINMLHSFGLQNTGVICYFNSLTQSLISCSDFISVIHNNKAENKISATFSDFLTQSENVAESIMTINPILQHIIKEHKFFGQQQEDASEGFDLLIDKLGSNVESIFRSTWHVDIYCNICKAFVSEGSDKMNRVIMEKEYSTIYGSGVCEYVSGHMSMFADYSCSKCKNKNVMGMKISRMIEPPRILVISFNKFAGKWDIPYLRKMEVKYGLMRQHSRTYRLAAIIQHYGGCEGGHYTAIGTRMGKSYLFNDTNHAEADLSRSPNDYMLFYTI